MLKSVSHFSETDLNICFTEKKRKKNTKRILTNKVPTIQIKFQNIQYDYD